VVGVGIGGTFDKAALMAKQALLRAVDSHNDNPFYAQLEEELLEKINALGIGPQGFGGRTTALAVNIETCPTHIAGLPVAVSRMVSQNYTLGHYNRLRQVYRVARNVFLVM
jgi:fumarate hydratase subunit alpha